ncbi:hypothetical protein MSAN_01913300 [Mycena sanguinolenta]|uniref:Arrestin-like N-terminal domain-containing protein n=1 Tax=Mycena sanguinolenta TaxID=230812 RepID=A0A8H6XPE5_9AGAR|nr:hypothetical protein MSAN_01913300 [Mycena sanguinolenta]
MSLLRDVLKKNQQASDTGPRGSGLSGVLPLSSKRSVKSYASSIKSAGGATVRSLAESMLSFYSMVTLGGTRVPKRRRPDFSRLGVPEWYMEDPPPPPLMPGTEDASPVPLRFIRGTAAVLHARNEGEKPWLGLVVYSHARPESVAPMYHNAAKVTGEVRLDLEKPAKIGSIDVWVTAVSDSVLDIFKPPILAMTANLWNRQQAPPGGQSSKGKFPNGQFIFPFEFPELPTDTLVIHPNDAKRRNKARVPLPPSYFISKVIGFSGNIKYTVGINIVFDGLGAIDDEFDMTFQYFPLCKALPRVKTPFPYIPTREDWPFSREVVGGWTLTPFGGRGRLGEEMVEIEGILGVQEPAVYTAGQTIEFSLLLWSTNPLALEALGQPAAIQVGFYKSDIFGLDVMTPRTSTRKNRYLEQLSAGRMWLTDDGRPADDEPIPKFRMVTLPDPPPPGSAPRTSPASAGSHRLRGAPSSRMKEVWTETYEDDQPNAADAGNSNLDALQLNERPKEPTFVADNETLGGTERAPSPTPSLEDIDLAADGAPTDHFVRLDGEVRVPACSHPSFRYTHMGREYVVHLVITHPQYSHISPNATGLLAEFPVWYVFDRFGYLPPGVATSKAGVPQDLSALPNTGTALSMGPDAVRAPVSIGAVTEEKRPTAKFTRYFAF